MKRRLVEISTILALVLSLASQARAEQSCARSDSEDENREQAAAAFDEGQRLFSQNEFQGAVEQFRCSYILYPHQATLFNLGESAESAGDTELALTTFRLHLERYPEAEGHSAVQRRVRDLEERLAAATEDGDTEPEERETDGEVQMSGARRAAWGLLGAGLALGITGGVLYGVAVGRNGDYLQNRDDFEQGGDVGWSVDEFDDQAQRGRGLEAGGWALMGIGLATLVAFVVLFVAFDGEQIVDSSERQASVSLVLGGELGVVSFRF